MSDRMMSFTVHDLEDMEATARADERRRVLDELESRVRERQSYGSTALDGVLSDIGVMRLKEAPNDADD